MSRRTLVDGLKETPAVDSEIERQYVRGKPITNNIPAASVKMTNPVSIARTPISTRLRTDLAEALKRASLQRQLEKASPSSLTEILESAIEPWLKEHGYLS